MLRKQIIFPFAAVFLAVIASVTVIGILLYGYFVLFLFPADTIYAPGYSEAGFKKIAAGMTTEDVAKLVGLPLLISEYSDGSFVRDYRIERETRMIESESKRAYLLPTIDKAIWYYSQHGSKHDNFYVRVVTFSGSNRVLDKHASFYSD